MSLIIPQPVLKGSKALVVGIANDSSIAYGCARAFHELDADLGLSYLNEKARPFVEPLARELEASIFMPLDVGVPGELEALFTINERDWGQLDILVHSIAYAPLPDLQGGLLNCSAEGFAKAMVDVGFTCAYLATPYARRLSGETLYVDGGVNILA